MLTSHISSPITLARLQQTPCGPHLDNFTAWLEAQSYSSSLIQLYLYGVLPLGAWMTKNGLTPVDFNHHVLERFRVHRAEVNQWKHNNGNIKAAFRGAKRFHDYLVVNEITAGSPAPTLSLSTIQRNFDQWMATHRGVTDITLRGYWSSPDLVDTKLCCRRSG